MPPVLKGCSPPLPALQVVFWQKMARLLVTWCAPDANHQELVRPAGSAAQLRLLTMVLSPTMAGEMVFVQLRFLEALSAWADSGRPVADAPKFTAYGVSAVLQPGAAADELPVLLPAVTPLLYQLCGEPGPANRLVAHVGVKGNPYTFSVGLLPQQLVLEDAAGQLLARISVDIGAWAATNQTASGAARTAAVTLQAFYAGTPAAQVRLGRWGGGDWLCWLGPTCQLLHVLYL